MSFRVPDYLKNWRVLFQKTFQISADTSQVRVKASQFRANMPYGGIDIHFAGAGVDCLSEPGIYVLVRASYGDRGTAQTDITFNYYARCRYTDV